MQRSIGAAVERLAVDLYASRLGGMEKMGRRLLGCVRCVALYPLTFKENTGIHWKFSCVRQGALPARTYSESWQKWHRRVVVVLFRFRAFQV